MKNSKQRLVFLATATFGILTIVTLVATIVFARTLGTYLSGGVTVLIFGAITYYLFNMLDGPKAEAEVKIEDSESTKSEEKTDEVKTDPAQAPAAAKTGSSPSGFDEAVLSRAQVYFGEDYVKGINSQKDKVLREIDAGFNKGLKDAVDEYETVCGQKLNVFAVSFKTKTSKGGDKDVKE